MVTIGDNITIGAGPLLQKIFLLILLLLVIPAKFIKKIKMNIYLLLLEL